MEHEIDVRRARAGMPGRRVCCALLGICIATCAAASGEALERIVALVEDDPILWSEVQAGVLLEMEQRGIAPSDSAAILALRESVRERLIEQRVLQREAEAKGQRVTEEEVTASVDAAIARNKEMLGSEERFREQLKIEGLTEQELRHRYATEARREMLAGRLTQAEFAGQAKVTPEQARSYFEEHRAELPRREMQVTLQRIAFLVRPDSVIAARTREQAAEVARRIRAGETSFVAEARYSDDPNGREGGDLQRVQRGDLAGRLGAAFEDVLFALPAGTVSDPVASPLGYHLLLVHEKDPGGAWVHVSHILYGVPLRRADEVRAQAEAERVLALARAGTPFDELVRRYSQAPEAAQGGTLGPLPISALDEPLRKAVDSLAIGGISDVIPLEGACLIARLVSREEERELTFAEVEQDLTAWLQDRQLEDQYQQWVRKIEERYYIERRPWE